MGRGQRARRHWSVPGLISVGAHAALIAGTLVGGLTHRGRISASWAAGTGESIRVELAAPASVASVATPARRGAAPSTAHVTPRARVRSRRPAHEPPPPPLAPGPNPLQPPPLSEHAAEALAAQESAPAAPSQPASPPTPAVHTLPTIDASYLRIEESYPRLPSSLVIQGRMYSEFVQICVDDAGRVSSVDITRGAAPELDELVRAAIRTWRYRPYVVADRAQPFCHRMIIHFEVE